MTEHDKLFFMPSFSCRRSQILSAIILDTTYSALSISPESAHIPFRIVINNNEIFYAKDALKAAESLFECGFYSESQYEEVKANLDFRLSQYEMVFGPAQQQEGDNND